MGWPRAPFGTSGEVTHREPWVPCVTWTRPCRLGGRPAERRPGPLSQGLAPLLWAVEGGLLCVLQNVVMNVSEQEASGGESSLGKPGEASGPCFKPAEPLAARGLGGSAALLVTALSRAHRPSRALHPHCPPPLPTPGPPALCGRVSVFRVKTRH